MIPYPCETKWARRRTYPAAEHNEFFKHLTGPHRPPIADCEPLPEVPSRPKRARAEYTAETTTNGLLSEYHLPLETPANVAAVEQRKVDDIHNERLVTPPNPSLNDEDALSHQTTHRLAEGPNYPVPDNFGTAVWAKFYPPHHVKPNDLVDCIGILSEAPSVYARSSDLSYLEDTPAPSAPRFHVILMEDAGEGHPFIPNNLEERESRRLEVFAQLASARQNLLLWMSQALGGDDLAAEYLLYNLISRPILRPNDTQTIGHIPLNFIIPADLTSSTSDNSWSNAVRSRIESVLETLVPRRHTLLLNPTVLSSRNLSPYLSPENNRLESGVLQLPSGTHLLVDETSILGVLGNSKYKKQLEEVSHFIHNQLVEYNVISYSLPFHVDCPVVVLSQGKSIFEMTCALPLQCNLDLPYPSEVSEEDLDLWRALIGYMRLSEWGNQDESVLSIIEQDFVAIRQDHGNEYLTEATFEHWNNLARASTISYGESLMTELCWTNIKALESSRLSRL